MTLYSNIFGSSPAGGSGSCSSRCQRSSRTSRHASHWSSEKALRTAVASRRAHTLVSQPVAAHTAKSGSAVLTVFVWFQVALLLWRRRRWRRRWRRRRLRIKCWLWGFLRIPAHLLQPVGPLEACHHSSKALGWRRERLDISGAVQQLRALRLLLAGLDLVVAERLELIGRWRQAALVLATPVRQRRQQQREQQCRRHPLRRRGRRGAAAQRRSAIPLCSSIRAVRRGRLCTLAS